MVLVRKHQHLCQGQMKVTRVVVVVVVVVVLTHGALQKNATDAPCFRQTNYVFSSFLNCPVERLGFSSEDETVLLAMLLES